MLLSVCMGGFGGQQQRREQFQRASDPQQTLLHVRVLAKMICRFSFATARYFFLPWCHFQMRILHGWSFKPGRYASFILYNVHAYTLKVLMNGPHPIMHSSLTKVSGVARGDSYSSWPASALPLLLFVIRNECSSPSWTICRWWWRWRSSKETNQKWQEFINASTFNITIIIVMVQKIKPKIRWGDNFTWKVE